MTRNKIKRVQDFGQSIWLDYFDRKIMDTGKLERMIETDGVTGVTANPSIFEEAITSSSDYDKDIAVLSKHKKTAEDIFFALAIKDIRRAADLFRPVYEETNGNNGFVSLEISPHLAHDTEGSVRQARALWRAINRSNLMIKIPSTIEGLAAIRKCISEGININITLLFGLPRYKQVIDAYLFGLEDRVRHNKPIDRIVSVASFFLSRIDALIDPLLERQGLTKMKGQVAIASAKKAYAIYNEVFSSARFKNLEAKGAKRQRVLWASTSSKDPSFSDVKYVEALIGSGTINTIPIKVMDAFNEHGRLESQLEGDLDKAISLLLQLKIAGIDINAITQQLEEEGIEKFNKSYDKLLETIEKRKQVAY